MQFSDLKMKILTNLTLLLFVVCQLFVRKQKASLLCFDDFYSQSFIPDALQIAYYIDKNMSIYYNITALIPFPGKILFNVFVRRLAEMPGEAAKTVLKYKNSDFCKTLDRLKNFTTDHFQSESLLQPTFITSCPLTRGFYYISNGTVEDEIVPMYFPEGQYWLQFELVQVFEEVTKLMNVKIKYTYKRH